MEQISAGEMERTMKVQEVILRAIAKKITWWQAAEIFGNQQSWKTGTDHSFPNFCDAILRACTIVMEISE
jgi:hypothetical protein